MHDTMDPRYWDDVPDNCPENGQMAFAMAGLAALGLAGMWLISKHADAQRPKPDRRNETLGDWLRR